MHPEIERIVVCDEEARSRVEEASIEARRIQHQAEEDAKALKGQMEKGLEEYRQKELSRIIQQAREQARQKEEKTRQYCEGLRKRAENELQGLGQEFLDLFLRAI